jgi:hypothetical protein
VSDKKSKKSVQGSPLPPDGTRLGDYPIGSCVMLEVGGSIDWYMIACCLGGNDNPHLRKMFHPPSSADWNVGPSDAREFRSDLTVVGSAWPRRVADERGLDANADVDPMVSNLRLESPGSTSPAVGDGGGGVT